VLGAKTESPSVLQRQIDAILQYSQQAVKVASSQQLESTDIIDGREDLSELEFAVLVAVGKQCEIADDVAKRLRLSVEKARYYLDELDRKHRLIDCIRKSDPFPNEYRLTHEGRRLLVKRGVFD
jgi:hypothetical protein